VVLRLDLLDILHQFPHLALKKAAEFVDVVGGRVVATQIGNLGQRCSMNPCFLGQFVEG
jgi:hypothetical protein